MSTYTLSKQGILAAFGKFNQEERFEELKKDIKAFEERHKSN